MATQLVHGHVAGVEDRLDHRLQGQGPPHRTRSGPDERTDLRIPARDRPDGFIRSGERQRGVRYRAAVAVPLLGIALGIPALAGALAVALSASSATRPDLWAPALQVGAVAAVIAGLYGMWAAWPEETPSGPVRNSAIGVAAGGAVAAVATAMFALVAMV